MKPIGLYVALSMSLLLTACGDAPANSDNRASEQISEVNLSTALSTGEPYVDIYDASKACNGTTFFGTSAGGNGIRILDIAMDGSIAHEYAIPSQFASRANQGLEVEKLANGNLLLPLGRQGIFEIDPDGNIVWSHGDSKVSHDVDRLDNGNTLYVYGAGDSVTDEHVKEVDASGNIVWSWSASQHYSQSQFPSVDDGWTHMNAVTRLPNGNTIVNPRNFQMTIELNQAGEVIWEHDWLKALGVAKVDTHDPEILDNGNMLICMQFDAPYQAAELNRQTGEIVWGYYNPDLRTTRDCNRLSNGNTLLVTVSTNGTSTNFDDDESVILEITPSGEIVWRLRIANSSIGRSPGVLFKAERAC